MFAYCLNNPVNLEDYSGMAARNSNVVIINDGARAEEKTFFEKVGEVYQEAKDYIYNDDEQKVLEAEHIAFYKGTSVVKVPWMDGNALSFGVIFMASNVKDSPNLVKHEYGHILQLNQVGFATYTSMVAMPSLIGYGLTEANVLPDELYYNLPWERSADYLGNANRSYMSWANTMGFYILGNCISGRIFYALMRRDYEKAIFSNATCDTAFADRM